MNWSRAKTILIFLFLGTAIFQLFVIFTSDNKANKISPEIITSTVQILKENGININKSIIPKENHSLPMATADNAITDYSEFASLLIGNDYTIENEKEYSSDIGTIRFYANRFNFTMKNSAVYSENKDNVAIDNSKKFLEGIGFDLSTAEKEVKKTESGYCVVYTNTAASLPVFNSQTIVSYNNIQGTWFNITDATDTVRLKSITSVLIDLIKEDIPKPAEITDISLGYIIPENKMYQKSVTLIPAWQITFDSGEKITIDARSPQ